MALTPDTDQFSQFLRLAFLRSPNYVAGSSGWTINQDGSVEFNNGTFRGNIVGGALFIYSGAGALGNPPQLAIVAPGVTQDPFGNAITSSKILMQGSIITETGGVFRTAATSPLIQIDGPSNAQWFFDSGGNLVLSLAQAAGTILGQHYLAGMTSYDNTNGFAYQFSAVAARGIAIWSGSLGAGWGALPIANISGSGSNLIEACNGSITLKASQGTAHPPTLLVGSANGFCTFSGEDNNAYDVGTLHLVNSANFGITATPQTITGLSAPVNAVPYKITADLIVSIGTTAVSLTVGLTGPAVSSLTNLKWAFYQDSTGGQNVFSGHNVGALGSVTEPGTTWPANSVVQIKLSAYVTFTAAGTLALQISSTPATTLGVVSLGSTMELEEVGG